MRTPGFKLDLSTNRANRRGLVPHIGFEPMISALRGRCPGPLDECGPESQAVRAPRPVGMIAVAPRDDQTWGRLFPYATREIGSSPASPERADFRHICSPWITLWAES